jgi:hypothetical protein
MPLSVFRDTTEIKINERLIKDGRIGTFVGVNSNGTIRIRFDDNKSIDEFVDPADVSLIIEAI